ALSALRSLCLTLCSYTVFGRDELVLNHVPGLTVHHHLDSSEVIIGLKVNDHRIADGPLVHFIDLETPNLRRNFVRETLKCALGFTQSLHCLVNEFVVGHGGELSKLAVSGAGLMTPKSKQRRSIGVTPPAVPNRP